MACSILRDKGEYLPSLAVIFWFFFSSFAWLYFIGNWMPNSSSSYFDALRKVNDYSHGDISWRRLFFFLPMEAGMSMVFAVIYLAMRKETSLKIGLIALILSTTLIFIHEYAALALLIALLSLVLVLHPNNLRKIIPPTSLGCVFSLSIYFILQNLGISVSLIIILTYMSLGIVPTIILFLRTKLKFTRNFNTNIARHMTCPFIVVLLVIYLSCVIAWLSGTLPFSIGMVNKLGYVTAIYYPVLFGTIGVLCILSFIASSHFLSQRLKVIILFTSILIILNLSIGYMQLRLISDYTYNFMSSLSCQVINALLSLRERRFIEILRPFIALMAVPFFSQKIFHRFRSEKREVLAAGVISFFLLSSVMSGLLGFEYRFNQTSRGVSPAEFEAIETLRFKSYETVNSIGITLNSISDLKYASIPIIHGNLAYKAAFASIFPELPLSIIRKSLNSTTLFYLDKRHDNLNVYKEGYLYHLLQNLDPIFENNEGTIYRLEWGAPPTLGSETAMVIPVDDELQVKTPFYFEELARFKVFEIDFREKPVKNDTSIKFYNTKAVENAALFDGNSYARITVRNVFDELTVRLLFKPLDTSKSGIYLAKWDWGRNQRSFSIGHRGKDLILRFSPDGVNVRSFNIKDILVENKYFFLQLTYDGQSVKFSVNGTVKAKFSYNEGISQNPVDITICSELKSNQPCTYGKAEITYVGIFSKVPLTSMQSLYYAYDLLTFSGFNYTTILSIDPKINGFHNLIIPYDDLTFDNVLKEYSSANRTIIILNTNGYGPILNLFAQETNITITSNKILLREEGESRSIESIVMPKLIPKQETEVLLWYMQNDSFKSPFIMRKAKGSSCLVYVNVYPLIKNGKYIRNFKMLNDLPKILGLKTFNSETNSLWYPQTNVPHSRLLYSSLEANGTISILTVSAVIPKLENATLCILDGQNEHTYSNISSLSIHRCENITINSKHILQSNGIGFYGIFRAINPEITIKGSNITLELFVTNGTSCKRSVSGQLILRFMKEILIVARSPSVNINGISVFDSVEPTRLAPIRGGSKQITFNGQLQLKVGVADAYSFTHWIKLYKGCVCYNPPLIAIDESAYIPPFFQSLFVISFVFSIVYIMAKRESNRT